MEIVESFLAAFDAECWQVRAIHHDRHRVALAQVVPAANVASYLPRLRHLNSEGFHIFARPQGHQYILLDDLRRDVLSELATVRPCALMETSPGNYQAWLILPETPQDDARALQLCRHFAARFQGDMASAKPHQIGRLPGFDNRKPKYEQNGQYPLVKLHKAQRRFAQVELPEPGQSPPPVVYQKPVSTKGGSDRSAYDFQFACLLVQQGKPDWKIMEILKKKSLKALERPDPERYLTQTIRAAREKTGIHHP